MQKIKNTTRRSVNFVNRHRFGIGVTVGLSAGLALVVRNQSIVNEFLTEHDLYDAFYEMSEV